MRLIQLRFVGLAAMAAAAIIIGRTEASADPFFSFFETTDDKPAARIALAATPYGGHAPTGQEPVAAWREIEPQAAAIGTWTTVVLVANAPRADRSTSTRAISTASAVLPGHALPGPRLTGTGHSLNGIASYYWQDQMTATGERFNRRDLTAAHRTLPFGTRVRVTRLDTGSSVIVRINDRGPFKENRVIDLSERAAEDIGMTGSGLTNVSLEVLGQ